MATPSTEKPDKWCLKKDEGDGWTPQCGSLCAKLSGTHEMAFWTPNPDYLATTNKDPDTGCTQESSGFFFRPPPNSGRSGCIKYGDDVVIAQTDHYGEDQCGWYGCRVAKMSTDSPYPLQFDHGGDSPEVFYLKPPKDSGKTGCINYGDQVVIAQTGNAGNTDNCGWYGCRVAYVDDDSEIMVFYHGGSSPKTFYLQKAGSLQSASVSDENIEDDYTVNSASLETLPARFTSPVLLVGSVIGLLALTSMFAFSRARRHMFVQRATEEQEPLNETD